MKKILALFLLLPSLCFGTVKYVADSGGSDSNSGNSAAAAYASIGKFESVASPGDTVILLHVGAGTGWNENVNLTSGSAGSPITHICGIGPCSVTSTGASSNAWNATGAITDIVWYGIDTSCGGTPNSGTGAGVFTLNSGSSHPARFAYIGGSLFNCGGGGLNANKSDCFVIDGVRVYNNAAGNTSKPSGISLYQQRVNGSTTAQCQTFMGALNPYYVMLGTKNIIRNNFIYGNTNVGSSGTDTDGNGIIIDDWRRTQQNSGDNPSYSGATTYHAGDTVTYSTGIPAYSGGTNYSAGDIVQQNSGTTLLAYVALQTCTSCSHSPTSNGGAAYWGVYSEVWQALGTTTGNAPPASPATSNANWTLFMGYPGGGSRGTIGGVTIEGNTIFGNGGDGIEIFHSDDGVVRWNTFYENLQDPVWGTSSNNKGEINVFKASGWSIYDNIVYATPQVSPATSCGPTQPTSCYYPLASQFSDFGINYLNGGSTWGYGPNKVDHNLWNEYRYQYSQGNDSTGGLLQGVYRIGDPQFVNPTTSASTADFRLKPASPAIGYDPQRLGPLTPIGSMPIGSGH